MGVCVCERLGETSGMRVREGHKDRSYGSYRLCMSLNLILRKSKGESMKCCKYRIDRI